MIICEQIPDKVHSKEYMPFKKDCLIFKEASSRIYGLQPLSPETL